MIFAVLVAAAEDKPRVFITESGAFQLTGESEAQGNLALTGGTSPNAVEVMKQFTRRCPEVTVTANRDKADYVVRLDHEGASPTTLFVHGNKVAVFDREGDLIHGNATRLLSNAVKGACSAILAGRGAAAKR
jgi:hypothetical protein